MQQSGRRLLAQIAAILAVAVVAIPGRGTGQQPASVVPTIPIPLSPHATAKVRPHAEKPNGKDEIPEFSLGECIAIAIERQPALRAVRSSQDATSAGQQALHNIGRLGAILSPDLPIRKEQSNRGAIAAAADVQKLHNEVVHDVTRLYYTVVYAKQAEQLADDIVAQIEAFVKIAKELLKLPARGDFNQAKLDLMLIALAEVRDLQATAQAGSKQAMAALQEVMAVQDGTISFTVQDQELPIMAQTAPLTKETVVALALARRPELALAAAGADAFRLEVYAQGQIPFRRTVPTLGSASDIHSRLLPTGSRDPGRDYRPEPIPPEMPPQLVGGKADRVARAAAYSHRADAVYEKARNLMILEAENAFFHFEMSTKKMAVNKEAFTASKDLMEQVRGKFDDPKAAKDQLLLGYSQAAKSQAKYLEVVFQHLLALGALERVTAGGVRPAFPGR